MGWFDFLKQNAPLPPTPEEERPAHDPGEKNDRQVSVPEGHEVIIHHATPDPSVVRTRGGVVLANFGVAGDDPDVELDAILRAIEAVLAEDAAPANVVNVNRDLGLHELFAPASLQLLRFQSPLSWIFHQGSVESLSAEPRRLQAVLRCMYVISKREGAPIQQAAYLVEPPSPGTLPFVRLIRGMGLTVKQPDDQEGGLSVLVEVVRPEGPILCVLAGKPYPGDEPADGYALTMNGEKAQAEAAGHESVLRRFQEQELAGLVERVGSAQGKTRIIQRAPRLRKIILDLEAVAGTDTGKGEMKAILVELLTRNASLLSMSDAHGEFAVRTYEEALRALPMFSDLRCLKWAAEDLGKELGSFKIAAIHPRALLAMAAESEVGIAIYTYRDRKKPVYAILPGPLVKSMAKAARALEKS